MSVQPNLRTSPQRTSRILLVEDQEDIAIFMINALQQAGWQVDYATCMRYALDKITTLPDVVLLDLGLPDGDGIDLINKVRTWSQTPIIVISARHAEQDKIRALDAGADDYLTKPFSINELLARVRTQLRRCQQQKTDKHPLVTFGQITVDRQLQQIWREKKPVHLTNIEYQLLCYFINHAGQVLTQRQLLVHVWGNVFSENAHYLRIYISHLRKKLEKNPAQPVHFLTETGIGYRLVLGNEHLPVEETIQSCNHLPQTTDT